jgi:23S rRNA (uracil1939-C5)-methyltransferase
VLPPKIGMMLPALRALIESLSIRQRLPQIELAVGERLPTSGGAARGEPVFALVLRILAPLTVADEAKLVAFADAQGVEFWLQPGGPETVTPFHPRNATLAYTLPEFDIALPFSPTEFTQVNTAINRVLVRRAVQLLDPRPGERIADFFCGLGNFTLPLARRGAFVIGVEGSAALAERAKGNARRNGLAERTQFEVANLFTIDAPALERLGPLDRVLIDPPREGAVRGARQRAARPGRQSPTDAHRVRIVQSGDARARCRGIGARARIRPHCCGRGEHVSAYRACGVYRRLRADLGADAGALGRFKQLFRPHGIVRGCASG